MVSNAPRHVQPAKFNSPSKRTDVCAAVEACLQREDDLHHLFPCWSDDDLALGNSTHLVLGHVRLPLWNHAHTSPAIVDFRRPAVCCFLAFLDIAVRENVGVVSALGRRRSVCRRIDMRMQEGLRCLVALTPFASRRVVAEEEHAGRRSADKNERDDESNAPRLRRSQALVEPERVVDHGHQEVGDAAASISPASDQRIGCSHNVLVEETRRPYLTRHECAAQDSDEEAQGDEAGDVVHEAGHCGRDGSCQQHTDVCPSRTEAIAERPCHESYNEGAGQSCDVGVCDVLLLQVEIHSDRPREQRWKCVPISFMSLVRVVR